MPDLTDEDILDDFTTLFIAGESVTLKIFKNIKKKHAAIKSCHSHCYITCMHIKFYGWKFGVTGQETTANVLSFLLCEVGRNGDILRK